MPITRCQENGKPGFRWGRRGKCYTYTPGNNVSRRRARARALRQARAILANQGGHVLLIVLTILAALTLYAG